MADDPANDGDRAAQDARAARRFWALQLIRVIGLALVLFGVVLFSRDTAGEAYEGPVLMALGAFVFFIGPRFLARRWKSPDA